LRGVKTNVKKWGIWKKCGDYKTQGGGEEKKRGSVNCTLVPAAEGGRVCSSSKDSCQIFKRKENNSSVSNAPRWSRCASRGPQGPRENPATRGLPPLWKGEGRLWFIEVGVFKKGPAKGSRGRKMPENTPCQLVGKVHSANQILTNREREGSLA